MRAYAWFLAASDRRADRRLLAYPAYELTSRFQPWAFHRVASRVAMLILAAELVWLCRHLALRSKREFGYGLPWRRFVGWRFCGAPPAWPRRRWAPCF